jgi:hypothetical protein
MKMTLKHPQITTVWPINSRSDVVTTVDRIQEKLRLYGVISERERQYLDKHKKIKALS